MRRTGWEAERTDRSRKRRGEIPPALRKVSAIRWTCGPIRGRLRHTPHSLKKGMTEKMFRSVRSLLSCAFGVLVALLPLAASASVLWFGDKDSLHQIDTASNHVVVDVPFEPAVAIAVNAADSSVWTLTQKRLALVSSQGALQLQIALRDLGSGLGAPRFLALNPNDASVWAGFENRVLHFDATGALRHTLAIAPSDLAVAQDGSLWTLSQSLLEQRDSSAALVKSVSLGGAAKGAKHLAIDDTGGAIWLAGDKDVVKLNLAAPDQTLLTLVASETTSAISVDLQSGDLWILGQNTLFALTRDGSPRISRDLRDFSISNPQTLVFDFASQAVWVGHQQGLSRIATTGALIGTFPADVKTVAIAIGRAPLNITPVVTIVSPADGALVNTGTPLFRVKYDALCGSASCGFPSSFFRTFTLAATVNGTDVSASFVFDPATGGATFTPGVRLPEGTNTWSAQARDPFGRTSDTVSASFTIDTIAPIFSNVAPPTGSSFASPSITITGSVDDPQAVVTLGAQTQGRNFSFPVVLSSGFNNLTLTARDPAGNIATFPLTYLFNLPPLVSISSPHGGDNFTAPASFTITADASDSDGIVAKVEFFKNGASIAIDPTFPYSASVTALPEGTYVLTAQATDDRGATTMSAPVTISVGPPNALPSVEFKSPAAGTKFSAPANIHVVATAADSDGTISKVEFFRDGALAATATSAPYEATLNNVPAGNHTLTAKATDDRGGFTTTPGVSVFVSPTLLSISSPLNGASINDTTVFVKGAVVALPNSGVAVNGLPAPIDSLGNFFVNVPLNAGANTITATLTTNDGTVVTQSISVTSSGVASPFAIAAAPSTGMAPLPVTFTVLNSSPAVASCTFLGLPFSLPAGATVQLSVTFPAGVWDNTLTCTSGGLSTTLHSIVESRDPVQMDQMFRSIWSGLNTALVAGDKDGAMRYLNESARRKFGPVFDALIPFMSEIVSSYSPFAQSQIGTAFAEYAVSRMDNGQKRFYLIYFVLGADGVWRIDEM